MPVPWQFSTVSDGTKTVLAAWLGRNTALQARMDAQLRRLRHMEIPWPMPYYEPLGKGVGAIRFDLAKVEHRLYGYFGPGSRQFTVIRAASGKKRQQADIVAAQQLRKTYELTPPRVENYDV